MTSRRQFIKHGALSVIGIVMVGCGIHGALAAPVPGATPKQALVLNGQPVKTIEQLKRQGKTILLVEQSVESALGISDRAYILDQGGIVYTERAATMLADPEIQERYCAV